MVVIRLARIGKKKQAFYRVVAADSKRPVQAKFIEILGWYNPYSKELNIKEDRVADWLKKGAQPSNTVAKLLKSKGVKLPEWVNITEKKKKPKGDKASAETAPVKDNSKDEPKDKPNEIEPAEEEQEIEDSSIEETPSAEDEIAEEK